MKEAKDVFESDDFKRACVGLSDREIQIAKAAASGQKGEEWGPDFRNLPRHKQTRVVAAICTASRLKNEGRS
jgi:hypothetical protein